MILMYLYVTFNDLDLDVGISNQVLGGKLENLDKKLPLCPLSPLPPVDRTLMMTVPLIFAFLPLIYL